MKVITIPKQLAQKGDLVVIPRKDYEKFLIWQRSVRTFKPTASQKRDLARARREREKGNVLTLDELKDKLGLRN